MRDLSVAHGEGEARRRVVRREGDRRVAEVLDHDARLEHLDRLVRREPGGALPEAACRKVRHVQPASDPPVTARRVGNLARADAVYRRRTLPPVEDTEDLPPGALAKLVACTKLAVNLPSRAHVRGPQDLRGGGVAPESAYGGEPREGVGVEVR